VLPAVTEVQEATREGSTEGSALENAGPESEAGCAQRAKSLTRTALTALTAFWAVVTLRVQKAGVRVAAVVDGPGSLVHDRLPTFAEAWGRQCECARHYKTAMWCPWLRYPRYVWGFVYVCVVKPVLNLLEWLSESPLRFCITAVTVFAIYWFS